MEQAGAIAAIERLTNVMNCVRNQNSGADIHCVGNIRNTASGYIHLLENDYQKLDAEVVEAIVKRSERSVVEFFERKYGVMPFTKECVKHKDQRE